MEKGSAGFGRRLVAGGGLACRRRGLGARDTLILAFSHKGRRDPPASGGAWFRAAGLAAAIWIPAFAGNDGALIKTAAQPIAQLNSASAYPPQAANR